VHREDAPHEPFAYAPQEHGAVGVGVSTSVASTVALLERALAVLLPLLSPLSSLLSLLSSFLFPLSSPPSPLSALPSPLSPLLSPLSSILSPLSPLPLLHSALALRSLSLYSASFQPLFSLY
jgi:hypothetical protein